MTGAARPSILLVEDSEAIREAYTILLEESGFAVVPVADGPAALAAAAAAPPDLVLLDMGLPGMDGVQVTRVLKAQPATAAVPVLALTGRDDDATRRACLQAGCAEYLIKPISTQALLKAVARHCGDGGTAIRE